MENKRELGQFYTDYNPFKLKVFKKWFEDALEKSDNTVLEPFAGSNNLIKMLLEDYDFNYKSYDIEPGDQGVEFRDTIADYPKGYKLAITNPPYLSKSSAKRRKIKFPNVDFGDLYKLCLFKMLQHNDFVGAIVPINIIRDESFRDRLDKYIILNKKMFNTTETPVCLALFSPKETFKNTEIFNINKKLGSLSSINNYLQKFELNDADEIKFNSKKGTLFLRAVDNPKGSRISFGPSDNFSVDEIKVSSRHLTLIEVPFKVTKSKINQLNLILKEYRDKTKDVYLNAFMGLRDDGDYRRRLDYKTARKLILYYINEYGNE